MSQVDKLKQHSTPFFVDRSKNYTALFLLMSPLPLLYYLNSVLSLWNLDAFHYFLVQIIFFFFTSTFSQLKNNLVSYKRPTNASVDTQLISSPAKPLALKQKPRLTLKDETEQLCDTSVESLRTNSHRLTDTCKKLFEQFKTFVDKEAGSSSICWEVMADIVEPNPVTVYRDRHSSHRYRLECSFDSSPENAFQAMSTEKASDYFSPDSILKEITVLEHLDPNTLILYARTAGLWPSSARDICLVQSTQKLSDQTIMTVYRSVAHNARVIRPDSGVIRMEANLIGRLIRPIPDNPNRCSMVAYFEGDPKGWIPKSLVTFVASNFIPKALQKFNDKLRATSYVEMSASNCFENEEAEFDGYSGSILSPSSTIIDGSNSPGNFDKFSSFTCNPSSSGSSPIPSPSFQTVSRPTFWERFQLKFASKWFLKRLTSASVPVLVIATIFAFLSRRHKI